MSQKSTAKFSVQKNSSCQQAHGKGAFITTVQQPSVQLVALYKLSKRIALEEDSSSMADVSNYMCLFKLCPGVYD
uniref:Uncharacterized protein n=1 Tax=Romanomermis culicivorax TaxID=13658 RepID=A0A915LA99_ROMCU